MNDLVAGSEASVLQNVRVVTIGDYACNRALYQDNSNPSYRKSWYIVTKRGETYCMVPVPEGKEVECLQRANEIVDNMNGISQL